MTDIKKEKSITFRSAIVAVILTGVLIGIGITLIFGRVGLGVALLLYGAFAARIATVLSKEYVELKKKSTEGKAT